MPVSDPIADPPVHVEHVESAPISLKTAHNLPGSNRYATMEHPRIQETTSVPPSLNSQNEATGTLFIVATPIGNLADASPRTCEALACADLVLCEDTRRTGKLLSLLDIEARLRTCHEHDEERRIPEVLELLANGKNVALVSDAGTPGLSDPGYRLVKAAHEAKLVVSPIPGPSALLAAISVSGLPTDSFVFEGFLPRKSGARRTLLQGLADEARTLVFLETPHRLAQALQDLEDIFGAERPACLCRELTKVHEEVARATLAALRARFGGGDTKGEIVLVIGGKPRRTEPAGPDELRKRVRELIDGGLSEKEALKAASRELGIPKREAYRLVKLEPDEG